MMDIFRKQNPKHINALKKAIEKSDYKTIYKTAHTIRNSIGFFGLTQVIGEELLHIEKGALANDPVNNMKTYIDKIDTVCREAVVMLGIMNVNAD